MKSGGLAANGSQKTAAAEEAEIQELKAQLDKGEGARKLAVAEALTAVEKERDQLASELEQAKLATQNAAELAEIKRPTIFRKPPPRRMLKHHSRINTRPS